MARVAIINYRMGNIRSVINAVDYCGHEPVFTADPAVIAECERIILPGDGAFGDAMAHLQDGGLIETLSREVRDKGKPFLGICVGMQVLAATSNEHLGEDGRLHDGLGWIPADVVRIEPKDKSLKIPHMGWNNLHRLRDHPVLAGIRDENLSYYFVHSYWMRLRDDASLVATADYGEPLTAIVASGNVVATQFHPEKSQDSGIELLSNFLSWTP